MTLTPPRRDDDLNTRFLIERMQRAGCTEHEITSAVREMLGEQRREWVRTGDRVRWFRLRRA